MLALFVALGGTAYAATNLPRNSVGTRELRDGAVTSAKIRDKSVTGADVADGSLTGAQIRSSTLGKVPSALHADNSDLLGGSPPADFRLHCPTGLTQAADLCFDFNERSSDTYSAALTTCARAQLRLPNAGELALVFDHLGASQDSQWIADVYFFGTTGFAADAMADNSSRQPMFTSDFIATGMHPYRCVTSPSN